MKSFLISTVVTLGCQIACAQSVPSLINYQGRLTDTNGAPLAGGNYGIQFKLWDSPTNLTGLIWAQQQDVSVQASGVFNVILGAPGGGAVTNPVPAVNDLAFAFTASNRFLGLKVVSRNGVSISEAGEISPRQLLLSVPFAIKALSAESATNAAFATNAGLAAFVAPGSITTASLTAGLIQTTNLSDGSVTLQKLAARPIETNVPIGGLARSDTSANFSTTIDSFVDVTNLSVTIITTGRPVFVGLIPDGSTNASLTRRVGASESGGGAEGEIAFVRDAQTRDAQTIGIMKVHGYSTDWVPPGAFNTIDSPGPGMHTYRVQARDSSPGSTVYLENVKLAVYEL